LTAWLEAFAGRIGRKQALAALARKLAAIRPAQLARGLVDGRDVDAAVQATAAATAERGRVSGRPGASIGETASEGR
jgi:hypothetical protein